MVKHIPLLLALTLFTFSEASALKQYRCNGMVQYRPCDESSAAVSPRSETPRSGVKAPQRTAPAPKVFDDSFEQVSASEGLWRGKVTGYGFVQLALYIYERGNVVETRYMGGVELEGNSTFFAFKSMLPQGRNWTWVVKAYT